jgi:hypothetical protein
MKNNLKEIKQTKKKLHMNQDIGDLEETKSVTKKEYRSDDEPLDVKAMVPTLKDQVEKYSKRLERMLESKQREITEYKKDMKLISQIE